VRHRIDLAGTQDAPRRGAVCFAAAIALASAAPATAVPIPWKNCGASGDILAISKSDASVWPPPVAAPVSATATFDASGKLVDLRLFLVHGPAWTFDSGPLPTTTTSGFVALPASFPVSLTSPAPPVPAGPYDTLLTFGDAPSVTIHSQGNLGQDVDAPVTTTVSLSTDGTPGFPLMPAAGLAYALHVEMTESGGDRVFCLDLTVPMKSDAPLVSVRTMAGIPALSGLALTLLFTVLLALGVAAARSHDRR
jgi:hypothetical protein